MSNEFGAGYMPEEYKTGLVMFEEGDYSVRIETVAEQYSKSGNLMRVISLAVQGKDTTIDFYLVKGEYFNSSMTKFFDCFNIEVGDFDIGHWVKKIGKAHIAPEEYTRNDGTTGKSMKIKYLVVSKTPDHSLPMGQRKQEPVVYNAPKSEPVKTEEDKFIDDIPF